MVNKTIGIMASAALASLVFASTGTEAATGTLELTFGHQQTSLDTRLSHTLGENVSLLVWDIASVDYSGGASNFTLVDLTYPLAGGLSGVLETQFLDDSGSARAGLQHYSEKGNFNAYFIATAGVPYDRLPLNAEVAVVVGYTPQFTEHVGLHLRAENITNVGFEGHNLSLQKARLGMSVDQFRFGVAADFAEVSSPVEEAGFYHNLGAFVGVEF